MEHIIDTFSNGCKNLFKNPVMFLPFSIYLAITTVFSIVCNGIFPMLMDGTDVNQTLLTVVSIAYYLVLIISGLYVTAGTIGMSKEAVSTGKTKFGDFFTYANKYVIRLTLVTIVLSIIQSLIVLFWIPVIYLCINSGYTMESFLDLLVMNFDALIPFLTTLILPSLFGLFMTLIYLVITSVLFYFILYAAVVDNMSVIESFKKSYAMVRQKFWKVIWFAFLIYMITSGIVGFAFVVFYFIALISVMLMLGGTALLVLGVLILIIATLVLLIVTVIVSVATYVWTTRFYMSFNDHELYVEEAKENLLETDF
jgi:hypothetical protein